jgi:hypothetical protein
MAKHILRTTEFRRVAIAYRPKQPTKNTLYCQAPYKNSLQVDFSYSASLEANDEKSTINT